MVSVEDFLAVGQRHEQRWLLRQRKFSEFMDWANGIFDKGRLPLFIPGAVDCANQTRIPTVQWKDADRSLMEDEYWLQRMADALTEGGCIQVRLGDRSFHLCVLDVDHDDLVEPLLEANPTLHETLQTRGSKGRHFWFYADHKFPGDYPRKKQQIICNGLTIEFLTEGNLCTIWGTHYKTGEPYQVPNKATPIVLKFEDLKLPVGGEWKAKAATNGAGLKHSRPHAHGTISRNGGINWAAYDAAIDAQEDDLVELLATEYFDVVEVDGVWRCGDITGRPATNRGSFIIEPNGRCTEWDDESHSTLMQAITSDLRDERNTYDDVFTFLAQQGEEFNFFMPVPLNAVTFPDMTERPRTICYDNDFTCEGKEHPAGIYLHGVGQSKKKEEPDYPTDDKICSPIKAAAITRTKEGEEHSLLLDFVPIGETEWRKILLSRASLVATKSDEARTQLASAGVEFKGLHWNKINDYLECLKPETFLTEVKLTGWVDNNFKTFILPHKTLGDITETYFDPGKDNIEYGIKGTLEEWKEKVAALAIGNNWLLFSLSSALVGPILAPLNLAGFGSHLWGDSSMGKTTLLRVAASVWGEDKYLKTWRTTSNGLEITCAKRSGTLLILDEAEEAAAETVAASLYMIANGRGKQRMQKDITERPAFNWRLCALSSGERTLEEQIESGRNNGKYKVGQEMRMVPLDPTHCAHGVFDELHGYASGAEFSRLVSRQSAQLYGNAGIHFIEQLIAQGMEALPARLDNEQTFLSSELNPSPQEGRVARNLAAVALAGELAIEYGVFPFPAGTVRAAVRKIFDGYLPPRTNGVAKNNEHDDIIASIRDFLDTHGPARFAPIIIGTMMDKLNHPRPVINLAGYWEVKEGKKYYLLTPAGLKEASKGRTTKRVTKALDEQNAFYDKGSGGETPKSRRTGYGTEQKKLYHIDYEKL
jgi:putative DNA primase/helicase